MKSRKGRRTGKLWRFLGPTPQPANIMNHLHQERSKLPTASRKLKDSCYTPTFRAMGGGSSTRMELAAGIIARAAKGPVHLGTDSQAFMTKANWIHGMISQDLQPKRPWALHKDGDLWDTYHAHVQTKGVHAVRISKVKGHATQDMIEDQTVRQIDKDGNDFADNAASEGVGVSGKPVIKPGARWAQRHRAYCEFLTKLYEYLIA